MHTVDNPFLCIGHKFTIMNKKRANYEKNTVNPSFFSRLMLYVGCLLLNFQLSLTTLGLRNLMCNSRNCVSLTADGA